MFQTVLRKKSSHSASNNHITVTPTAQQHFSLHQQQNNIRRCQSQMTGIGVSTDDGGGYKANGGCGPLLVQTTKGKEKGALGVSFSCASSPLPAVPAVATTTATVSDE